MIEHLTRTRQINPVVIIIIIIIRCQLHINTHHEQKINVADNSNGENFPNPLMSENKIYNCDAHPWPKNTILIAGNSMINSSNERRFSTSFKSSKVGCFSGVLIDDIYLNFIRLLRKKTTTLFLHMGTNNSPIENLFQIDDKLINLVHFVKIKQLSLLRG